MSDELQMVEETFEPEKMYVVKDLETLKVISNSNLAGGSFPFVVPPKARSLPGRILNCPGKL